MFVERNATQNLLTRPVKGWLRWAPWMFVLGLMLWHLARMPARVTGRDPHLGDFRFFFWAGEAVHRGENPYLTGATHLDGDAKTATEVRAYTAPPVRPSPDADLFNCTLTRISPTESKLIVRSAAGEDSEVQLADVAISLDGKPAALGDLKIGMTVIVGKPERNGYIYPPLIAFCYSPFAPLGITGAAAVLVEINIILLFAGIFFLSLAVLEAFEIPPGADRVFLVGLLMAGTCILGWDRIRSEVNMLQTNATVFFMWTLGFYLLRKRPLLAGIAVAFAFNVKYMVIPVLPYLLIRRQWKAAGGMVLGILFWALLPGTLIGFPKELDYLHTAFSGFLHLVGVPASGVAADVEPLDSGFSFSISSGLARVFEANQWTLSPLLVAALIGVAWLITMLAAYARFAAPIIAAARSRALCAVEYVVIMAVALAFSPQAGTRHAIMTMGLFTAGLALILFRRLGGCSWPLLLALVLTTFGLSYPPGNESGIFTGFPYYWRLIGMPYWCVLITATVLLLIAGRFLSTPIPQAPSKELHEDSVAATARAKN